MCINHSFMSRHKRKLVVYLISLTLLVDTPFGGVPQIHRKVVYKFGLQMLWHVTPCSPICKMGCNGKIVSLR